MTRRKGKIRRASFPSPLPSPRLIMKKTKKNLLYKQILYVYFMTAYYWKKIIPKKLFFFLMFKFYYVIAVFQLLFSCLSILWAFSLFCFFVRFFPSKFQFFSICNYWLIYKLVLRDYWVKTFCVALYVRLVYI